MRTFNDFIHHARRSYHITYKDARIYILLRLGQFKLNKLSVVCYINWADGETFTQKEIAKELGISQQVVSYHLNRLCKVWPHLFKFGSKPPSLEHIPRLPEDYEQTTKPEAQANCTF